MKTGSNVRSRSYVRYGTIMVLSPKYFSPKKNKMNVFFLATSIDLKIKQFSAWLAVIEIQLTCIIGKWEWCWVRRNSNDFKRSLKKNRPSYLPENKFHWLQQVYIHVKVNQSCRSILTNIPVPKQPHQDKGTEFSYLEKTAHDCPSPLRDSLSIPLMWLHQCLKVNRIEL